MSVNGLAPSKAQEVGELRRPLLNQLSRRTSCCASLQARTTRPAALDPGSTLSAGRVAAGHASRPSARQSSGVRAASTARVAGAHPPGMRTGEAHQSVSAAARIDKEVEFLLELKTRLENPAENGKLGAASVRAAARVVVAAAQRGREIVQSHGGPCTVSDSRLRRLPRQQPRWVHRRIAVRRDRAQQPHPSPRHVAKLFLCEGHRCRRIRGDQPCVEGSCDR